MDQSWFARTYKVGDEKDYLKLMNLVFSGHKFDAKRWKWEFKDNPFGSVQVFADAGGEIIGHMGLIYTPIKIGKLTVLGSQAVDLAVHPDFRGKGIFLKIGRRMVQEAENEGAILCYGVPNEAAYHGHLKYGWFYVSPIPVMTKPLSTKGLILFALAKFRILLTKTNLKQAMGILLLIKNSTISCVLSRHPQKSDFAAFRNHLITRFGDEFDELWREASERNQLIVARKVEYLNWRYKQKPNSNYIVIGAEGNKKLLGYVVLAIDDQGFQGWKKGYIVDLFANSRESTEYLIQIALDFFASKKVELVICWMMQNQPAYDQLARRGFVDDVLSPTKLICRINTSSESFQKSYHDVEKDWYFVIGDSDMI